MEIVTPPPSLFLNQKILTHYQIWNKDQIFIWVGDEEDLLVEAAAGMLSGDSTVLLGECQSFAQDLASKLGQRYQKRFFISCGFNDPDNALRFFVFRRILEVLDERFKSPSFSA